MAGEVGKGVHSEGVPIYLESTDRRWAVLRSPQQRQEPANHRRLFDVGLKQAPGFKAWLLARDLSGFNPVAPPPMALAKAGLIEASRPPLVAAIAGLIEEDGLRSVLTLREVGSRHKHPVEPDMRGDTNRQREEAFNPVPLAAAIEGDIVQAFSLDHCSF